MYSQTGNVQAAVGTPVAPANQIPVFSGNQGQTSLPQFAMNPHPDPGFLLNS